MTKIPPLFLSAVVGVGFLPKALSDDYYYDDDEVAAGAVVGIVFGVIVLITAIAVGVCLCVRAANKNQGQAGPFIPPVAPPPPMAPPPTAPPVYSTGAPEMPHQDAGVVTTTENFLPDGTKEVIEEKTGPDGTKTVTVTRYDA